MKLIVGLGNPGKDYEKTRHNIGFEIVKSWVDNSAEFVYKKKFDANVAELDVEGEKVIAVLPQTFMNKSGFSAAGLMNFYKLSPQDMLVVTDDIDRDFGSIRVRNGGGHGGHNGLRSIIEHNGEDFWRIKIGVSNQYRTSENASQFVLDRFTKEEEQMLPKIIDASNKQLSHLIADGLSQTTQQLDQPPSQQP